MGTRYILSLNHYRNFLFIFIDPNKREYESLMRRTWCGALPHLITKFMIEEFLDENEMDQFVKKVMAEVENPEYHIYNIL